MINKEILTKLNHQRTRIVATVGPACESPEMLMKLTLAGASVFRLNFSHGTLEQKGQIIQIIRNISNSIDRSIGILADLSGPKLRVGNVPNDRMDLHEGQQIRLTSVQGVSSQERLSVNFEGLHDIILPGRMILLDDGTVRLRVKEIEGQDVICEAMEACTIKSKKGVNLPGTHLPIPALTEKDKVDMKFAVENRVDFIALSFVRTARDVIEAKELMHEFGGEGIPLIAKIEQSEALDNLDGILEHSDGAMVARGDLGVEIPIQQVPAAQRMIIRKCNHRAMPVITATQMLNSMIESPSPTRAEVTDIFNAILQGSDAVMLSGETAAGKYPLRSVEMMLDVIKEADKNMKWAIDNPKYRRINVDDDVPEAICRSAVHIAKELNLDAIICATSSGTTAVRLSRFRPKCRLIAFSSSPRVVRRLNLYWGIQSRWQREVWESESELGESAAIQSLMIQSAKEDGLLEEGMKAIMVAGVPLGVRGSTNFMRVFDVT